MTLSSIDPVLADGFLTQLGRVWEFLSDGGPFMVLIGICSLVAIAVTLYKASLIRMGQLVPDQVEEQLRATRSYVAQGDVERLRANLNSLGSPLGRAALTGMSGRYQSEEAASEAAAAEARQELVRLGGGIAILEVIITIAPLLGLLGTVSGLVSVFSTLGDSGGGDADPAELARGIAMALNTTIAGLAVAVPSVVAHSYFTRKLEKVGARMEVVLGRAIADFHAASQEAASVNLGAPSSNLPSPPTQAS